MRKRTLAVLPIVAGVVALARRLARPAADPPIDEASTPGTSPSPSPPATVRVVRTGDPSGRGLGDTIAMDLERARAHHVEPVVEFLTYVQSRRGQQSHLLFVRIDDIDAMAEAADEPVDDFLDRLDQLGVVVSHN